MCLQRRNHVARINKVRQKMQKTYLTTKKKKNYGQTVLLPSLPFPYHSDLELEVWFKRNSLFSLFIARDLSHLGQLLMSLRFTKLSMKYDQWMVQGICMQRTYFLGQSLKIWTFANFRDKWTNIAALEWSAIQPHHKNRTICSRNHKDTTFFESVCKI